jgi:hypothetical protein
MRHNITTVQDDLVHEFIVLRRGEGLHRSYVDKLVGRGVARWADIPPGCGSAEVQRLITAALGQIPDADLPADDRRIVLAALGLEPNLRAVTLLGRTALIAADQKLGERTARRRVDAAFVTLARAVAKNRGWHDPERGWAVRELRTLVRLDRPAAEVVEEYTIVASRDGLAHLAVSFNVPGRHDNDDRVVDADIDYGARIAASKRLGAAAFWHLLALPKPLTRNETHTFTIVHQALDGHPIAEGYQVTAAPSLALVETRVRFDPGRRPAAVWRVDPTTPAGPTLALDGVNEVRARFDGPKQGFSYGVCWRHEPANT